MYMPIVRDERPFFMVSNDVIDCGLSVEAVACYMYICRFGKADTDDIMKHFKLSQGHMNSIWRELRQGRFVSDSPVEPAPTPVLRSSALGKPGFIYVLKAGPFYKIGLTKDPDVRRKALAVALPYKDQVIFTIPVPDMFGHERYLHELFAHKRANGEWFELTDDDLDVIRTGYAEQDD
jgi:hypothetical protein